MPIKFKIPLFIALALSTLCTGYYLTPKELEAQYCPALQSPSLGPEIYVDMIGPGHNQLAVNFGCNQSSLITGITHTNRDDQQTRGFYCRDLINIPSQSIHCAHIEWVLGASTTYIPINTGFPINHERAYKCPDGEIITGFDYGLQANTADDTLTGLYCRSLTTL